MRSVASLLASTLLVASTRLTVAGVVATLIFCVLTYDASRRVKQVLNQMDGVNDRLDDQAEVIQEIRDLVTGGDPPVNGG